MPLTRCDCKTNAVWNQINQITLRLSVILWDCQAFKKKMRTVRNGQEAVQYAKLKFDPVFNKKFLQSFLVRNDRKSSVSYPISGLALTVKHYPGST